MGHERHSVAFVRIPAGKASRLHYHPEAEESYYILRGQARIQVGENEAAVGPGDGVLIPSREPHKIWNSGDQDLEFLATWVPAWEPKNTVWLETLTE